MTLREENQNLRQPVHGKQWIARLSVDIHMQHDDDEILDYLTYPDVTWTGMPNETFTYWQNPEWTPDNPNRMPEGTAEYTIRYTDKSALEADEETRKWFLEGLPDGFAEWKIGGVSELTSTGAATLLQGQADDYVHDKMLGNPMLVVDNA